MADTAPKATKTDRSWRSRITSKTTTPYLAAALIASGAMAWYFFVFVPSQLEYFVGLRFRTLNVVSGQLQSKAENLGRSVQAVFKPSAPLRVPPGAGAMNEGAAANAQAITKAPIDAAAYLANLIPDVVLPNNREGIPVGSGLHLRVWLNGTPEPRPAPAAPCPETACRDAWVAWTNVVRAAREVSLRDFDDLIVANEDGLVVWQRESATPRLGKLGELVVSDSEPNPWFSFNWDVHTSIPNTKDPPKLPVTAFLKPVDLGGVASYLLIQSVKLNGNAIGEDSRQLYVAGVISRQSLQQQAMRIPIVWVIFFLLPLVLLFLALPFVKLATLTPKERYGAADVVLLGFAALCAFGIGSVLPFETAMVDRRGDDTLRDLAGSIEGRLAWETRKVLALAKGIQGAESALNAKLMPCGLTTNEKRESRCGLWEALAEVRNHGEPGAPSTAAVRDVVPGSIELDVVAWLGQDGWQTQKWTTKTEVTAYVSHKPYAHYADLVSDDLWQMPDDDQRFTIEPLRTPTTAEMGTVFALRLQSPVANELRRFLILNMRPQAVVDPLVPPGYGFAIIGSNGHVLFHSEEGLSLMEDFFEEVGDPVGVRGKARSGHDWTWSGDYHGRPHRFFLHPVGALKGCPWLIVTFQEMYPIYSAQLEQQSGTLRLGALNLAVFVLAGFGLLAYMRFRHRNIRDVFLSSAVVGNTGLGALSILTVFALAALAATYTTRAVRILTALYFVFAMLPILALAIATVGRHDRPAFSRLRERLQRNRLMRWFVQFCRACAVLVRKGLQWLPAYNTEDRPLVFELGLLTFLISIAPAVGFTRIVYRVEDVRQTEQWLEQVAQDWAARDARVRERVTEPRYSSETIKLMTQGDGVAASWAAWANTPGALDPKAVAPTWLQPADSYLRVLDRIRLSPHDRTEPGTVALDKGQGIVRRMMLMDLRQSHEQRPERPVLATADAGRSVLTPDTPRLPVFSATGLDFRDAFGWSAPTLFRTLLGLLIVGSTWVAVRWARARLMVSRFIPSPTLVEQVAAVSDHGRDAILVIGPPRTGKDEAVRHALMPLRRAAGTTSDDDISTLDETFGARVPLLELTLDGHTVDHLVAKVARRMKECGESCLDSKGRMWIHVSNLEAQLVTTESRKQVIHLFDRLLDILDNKPPRVLVVTTSVDPIANFEDVFGDERQTTYDDPIPEVELSRSSMVLSRFRRCYLPIKSESTAARWASWLGYDEARWPDTLRLEVESYKPLAAIGQEFEGRTMPRMSIEELSRVIGVRAEATYQLLWTSCTRSEKLVLVQLAQEGLINPKSRNVAGRLMAKGLIVDRPGPTIFNYTFREFLRGIERHQVVNQWEQMEGAGLWVMAGRLIGSSLVAGGVFFLLTQDFSVQSLLPILSGTGVFGIPIVRDLLSRVAGKSGGSPT